MSFRIFSWRNLAVLAFVLALGAALGIAALGGGKAPAAVAPMPSPSLVDTTAAQATPAPPAGNTPPDVPADEWNQVVSTMQSTADGKAQLPRMAEYLTFHHRAALWKASKDKGEDAASRLAWGDYLLQTLPVHVGRGELTAFEARTLETEVLQDRISDPVALQQAVANEDQALVAAEPKPDAQATSVQQAQMASYKQREAELTAQWNAMPPAQRDPKWLESQLDAARVAAFDGGK